MSIKKLPKGEIEITGEIAYEVLLKHTGEAVESLGSNLKIDGFRAGHIPENIIVKRFGNKVLLEETAHIALSHEYPKLLAEHKLFPLGRPKIEFIKLSEGKPFEFKILLAVMPEVIVADYKKIAKEHNKKPGEKIEVSEKEVEDFIMNIRKSHVDHSKHDHGVSKEDHDKLLEKEAPELTLAFVQKLGDFKDIADFKNKIRENVAEQKKSKAHEKHRLSILESIIEETNVDLPDVLIENELNKMTQEFTSNIAQMGATLEQYLEHIKKSESDLRKEWKKDAEKRVMTQLILGKIAGLEKIEADKKDIEKESKHLLQQHREADPQRVRDYVEVTLTNEKIFKFLETL